MATKKIIPFFDLRNKVAVITGGYGHLGQAMVRALVTCGCEVVVAGRSREKFEIEFSSEEREQLKFIYLDITDTNSIDAFFATLMNSLGRIDVLVNNAHSAKGTSQENMSDEEWAYTLDGVLGSVHKMVRAVIPFMKNQKSGKIINISSMYGIVSPDFGLYKGDGCEKYTNPPHYGAAKAAIIQLTKYYAVYLGKYGIQVNAIAPGPFPKDYIKKENSRFVERLQSKNPLNKVGRPEDLMGPIILLSSESSDFMTGQVIQVDGGWTIW